MGNIVCELRHLHLKWSPAEKNARLLETMKQVGGGGLGHCLLYTVYKRQWSGASRPRATTVHSYMNSYVSHTSDLSGSNACWWDSARHRPVRIDHLV